MQTALIIMTILGCDDSATQCHYVEMIDQRWATIQECDASSEDRLKQYSNLEYPVVVAVCQTPEDSGIADAAGELGDPAGTELTGSLAGSGEPVPAADVPAVEQLPQDPQDAEVAPETGLAARVLQRFKDALPETETLKSLVKEPVHVVSDGYSWVAKRLER